MVELWQDTIFPTFEKIIHYFTTPLNQLGPEIEEEWHNVGGSVISWILSLFPDDWILINLMIGGAVVGVIIYTFVKFVIAFL